MISFQLGLEGLGAGGGSDENGSEEDEYDLPPGAPRPLPTALGEAQPELRGGSSEEDDPAEAAPTSPTQSDEEIFRRRRRCVSVPPWRPPRATQAC